MEGGVVHALVFHCAFLSLASNASDFKRGMLYNF